MLSVIKPVILVVHHHHKKLSSLSLFIHCTLINPKHSTNTH